MSVKENVDARENAIEYAYQQLAQVNPGSKEYAILAEAVERLERSRREDSRTDMEAIIKDREIMLKERELENAERKEKALEKTTLEKVIETIGVVLPTAVYTYVVTKLIPRAEERDFVSPFVKNLNPMKFVFKKKN